MTTDDKTLDAIGRAAEHMDWQQVVLNGGPPCFYLEGTKFCGRAERWPGHPEMHGFISLFVLLREQVAERDKVLNDIAAVVGLPPDTHKGLAPCPVIVHQVTALAESYKRLFAECEQAEARVQDALLKANLCEAHQKHADYCLLCLHRHSEAAEAAALERASQHYWWDAGCKCGWLPIVGEGGGIEQFQQHILSLAPTDALREAKAQAVKAALDRVWILMAEGCEPEAAMEKVKEEAHGAEAKRD